MFLGEYNPNLTSGNRIVLPKKHREQLSCKTVVVSKGFDKCILVYAVDDWVNRVERQVDNLVAEGNGPRSDLERYLYTSAQEVRVDAQGRIVLPSDLVSYAGMHTETAVIGVGDHIEIWDLAVWQKHFKKIEKGIIR